MEDGGDELLTRLIARGEQWDPVEEQTALADVQAKLFSEVFEPVALSRYVLLSRLGAGGGGVVYRGYDPDLHRKVAIKVLRTGEGSTALASRERLLREAQAIAQLSHPNVVAVYDVGTLDDARPGPGFGQGVFMVMELIEGVDLRRWSRAQPRSWREVLEVFVAAGRGIEAAHARGIIHRDFKPTNVLVGDDGRVRVLDFGLARALGRDPGAGPPAPMAGDEGSPAMLDHELTDVGTVMGTPAYMAPEQHLGEAGDARTDQYCFCVALYEALASRRPFEAETLDDLLAAKRRGPPPLGATVPRRVGDAVMRGLAPGPQDRHPDMAHLLVALDPEPARRRRWMFGAAATVVAAVLGLAWWSVRTDPATGTCEDPRGRFEGVWDAGTRARAKAAFDATHLPYAADAWAHVEQALDAYALAWQSTHVEACEATLVDRAQSPEAMGRQMLCLDRQFESFAQLARLVTEADQAVVRNAVSATSRMPPPARCRDASEQLEARLDRPGPEREQRLALDARLLRAGVLRDAGKYDEARELTREVLDAPEANEESLLAARAHLLTCEIDWFTNHFHDAEQSCDLALVAAERSQSAPLAFRAMLRLARTETNVGHHAEGERIFRIAQARLESIPPEQRDPLAEAELAAGFGQLRDAQWREEEAMASLEHALELYEQTLGPDHPDLVSVLNGMGMVAGAQDQESRARAYYQRALAISEKNYGSEHPHVASLVNNLGGVYYEEGELDLAHAALARALAAKEAQLGADSPRLVTTLGRLGRVLADIGRGEDAIAHHERAVELQQTAQGRGSALLVDPLAAYARTLRLLGRCDEAMELLDRARAIIIEHGDASISAASEVDFEIGHCSRDTGDLDGARAAFERALAAEQRDRGPDARVPASVLLELARIDEHEGDPVLARRRLEQALRRCESSEGDPRLYARVEFALARLVAPDDPGRAETLVSEATDRVRGVPYATELTEAIEAWRGEHR